MKNSLTAAFTVLISLVLIGKVLNWFLHFDVEVSRMLNIVMFSLIGIAYIGMGFLLRDKRLSAIAVTCGVLLIAMNFFVSNMIWDILGIICIVIPMVIAKFHQKKLAK